MPLPTFDGHWSPPTPRSRRQPPFDFHFSFVKTFGMSASTIKCYLRLRRHTGDVQSKPIPAGPLARKRALLEEVLPTQVRPNPILTLEEHGELFEETHGTEVSTATISRALKRLGLPLKKDLGSLERDEQEREAFRQRVARADADIFVWVDECGTHTSMTRLYFRAPKGERAYRSVPRNRGNNPTLIPSMTLQGAMGEAMAVEGSTKDFVFEAHKTVRVGELNKERGCRLWFLPAYSPDFNPIEICQPQYAFEYKLSYHRPQRVARADGVGREARSRPYIRRRGGAAMSSRGAVPPRP
jgi:transposase